MKFAFSITTVLICILSVLVLFQYDAFSLEKAEEPLFTYNQEIDVTVDGGKLHINHHLSGLPDHALNINWPSDSGNVGCEEGKLCDRLSPDLSSLSEGKNGELNLSYDIPLGGNNGESILKSSPFAILQGGEVEHSILHLTDRSKMEGTWLTGLPLIGKQSLNFVDYSLFAGDGQVFELYWQKEPLSMAFKNEQLTLYSREEPSDHLKKKLDSVSFPIHVDLIVGDKRAATSRVLFIRHAGESALERDLAIATIQASYKVNKEDGILMSVLANLLTGQSEGNSLAKAMTAEMRTLSADQMDLFLKKLWELRDGSTVNAKMLDSYLGEILQGSVTFFERNLADSPFFPLVREDSRKVKLAGEVKKVDVIYSEHRILYSLKPIMDKLGYAMREGEHGLYLDNGSRSFRFPVDEPFYVLNERRYDAPTKPISKIGSTYYIEEKWLIRLFLLDITKDDGQISIDHMDGF